MGCGVSLQCTGGYNVEIDTADIGEEKVVVTKAMMGGWSYFAIEIDLENGLEDCSTLLLEFYSESPKNSSIENLVQIEPAQNY